MEKNNITESESWSALGLSADIASQLLSKGFKEPTSVQKLCIPKILEGASLMVQSKTGSGKTLGYLLPLVDRYLKQASSDYALGRVLVVVPTRELAGQVSQSAQELKLKTAMVIGGESEEPQIEALKKAALWIGTPGRLCDLQRRGHFDLKNLKAVVLDEADRLLDMGFMEEVNELLKAFKPNQSQALFFSATSHMGVEEFSYELGVKTERLKLSEDAPVETLSQEVAYVTEEEKLYALCTFLKTERAKNRRGVIFSNFKGKASRLCRKLRSLGLSAECLTSDLSQKQRTRILKGFKEEKYSVLLASDLAARGIDVVDLEFVVNYDLPDDPAVYVHRVGRTARAGKDGFALSLVGFEDAYRMERLEKHLSKKLNAKRFLAEELTAPLPEFSEIKAEPYREERRHSHTSRGGDRAGGRERDKKQGSSRNSSRRSQSGHGKNRSFKNEEGSSKKRTQKRKFDSQKKSQKGSASSKRYSKGSKHPYKSSYKKRNAQKSAAPKKLSLWARIKKKIFS